LAARTIGVDPADCVALEDSATGAASARAAGCYTIGVPSLATIPTDVAHHQVGSLEELDLAALADLVGARAS